MTPTLAHLRFAAALSYRAATPDGLARQKRAISDAAQAGLDPDIAYGLVERHRVPGTALAVLEATGMESLLAHRMDDLRRYAASVRRNGLVLAMRGEQARRAIERAGIRCIAFKGGPDLSRKLYGDIALRHCKDVDLIVPIEHLHGAFEALRADGWATDLSPVWFATPHHRAMSRYLLRDIKFHDTATGIQLELHTRFEHIPDPIMESMWWGAYPEQPCRNLTNAEFLFLVQHGTKHLWSRLKWLGDIAAALDAQPEIVEHSAPLARTLGLQDCFAPLSVLLRDLYGMELAGHPRHARATMLARQCLDAMERKEVTDMTAVEEAMDRQRHNRFRMDVLGCRVPRRRKWAHMFVASLVRPADIVAMGSFHWSLLPLLPVVRVASLLWRYAYHVLHPVPGGARK